MEGKHWGLTGNQLKILGMFFMTLDHIGCQLLPQYSVLRILGRLAFPIFAYMIAEGCIYTRSMKKYLGTLMLSAVLCQSVYWGVMGSLYMCVMVTFSISVGLVCLIKWAQRKQTTFCWSVVFGGILLAFFVAEILPKLLKGTDFAVDYGFMGIILPVGLYLFKNKAMKLGYMMAMLFLMAANTLSIQWYSLLAIPLLALYNGQRGKRGLKWMFYLYYPLHLVAIYGLSAVL